MLELCGAGDHGRSTNGAPGVEVGARRHVGLWGGPWAGGWAGARDTGVMRAERCQKVLMGSRGACGARRDCGEVYTAHVPRTFCHSMTMYDD